MCITGALFGQTLRIASRWGEDGDAICATQDALSMVSSLPDESISLVVTSPPYNIGKSYETRSDLRNYLEVHGEVVRALYRVLDRRGSICWQVGNFVDKGEIYPLDIFYYRIFKKVGMKLRNRIIWHFNHGLHAKRRFSGRYETILWFTKGDDYTFNLDDVRVASKYPGKRSHKIGRRGAPSGNPLGKNPSDVWALLNEEWERGIWEIPNVKAGHPEKTIHPCQFPIELAERCILALSNPGEWVLDPYMGSGSTLLAALRRGRRAIGCDVNGEYVQLTISRLQEYAEGRLRCRPLGRQVQDSQGKVSRYPTEWQSGQQSLLPS